MSTISQIHDTICGRIRQAGHEINETNQNLMCPMLILFPLRRAGCSAPRPFFDRGNRAAVILSTIAAFLVALSFQVLGEESLQDKMTRGLLAEEAQQDLRAAAAAYAEVVKIADQQRNLAASALFRLADVQRRLGQTDEAMANYRRLIGEFANYTNLAALAAKYVPEAPVARADYKTEQEQLLGEEIVLAERSLEEIRRRQQAGITGGEEVLKAERDVLRLKREMAALRGSRRMDLLEISAPAARDAGATESGISDEEAQEIARLRKLTINSPDLINAVADGKNTPLIEAAGKDQPQVLEFLLKQGADVNKVGIEGFTALAFAAGTGHKKNVEILLSAGARVESTSPNERGPLNAAVSNGHRLVVDTLLKAGASINRQSCLMSGSVMHTTPLGAAVEAGRVDMVEYLLEKGADPNTRYLSDPNEDHLTDKSMPLFPLARALVSDYWKIAERLLNAGANPNPDHIPLFIWARSAPMPVLELLHAKGCDINGSTPDGRTPLGEAILRQDSEQVRWFVANGADMDRLNDAGETPLAAALQSLVSLGIQPHEVTSKAKILSARQGVIYELIGGKQDINHRNRSRQTPLMLAAQIGSETMVSRLLAAGADPNLITPSGLSILGYVLTSPGPLQKSRLEMAKLLLNAGADPNAGNTKYPPLHSAIDYGELGVVKLLLVHKASLTARNAAKMTPLDLARHYIIQTAGDTRPNSQEMTENYRKIETALIEAGARENGPDPDTIRISRSSQHKIEVVFERYGTNDLNQFSLHDLLAVYYGVIAGPQSAAGSAKSYTPGLGLPFPDLDKMVVTRFLPQSGAPQEIRIPPGSVTNSSLAGNIPLEWGDIVEIPEKDHPLDAKGSGLPREVIAAFDNSLPRDLSVRVGGDLKSIQLRLMYRRTPSLAADEEHPFKLELASWNQDVFTLAAALRFPGLVRSSSDLSRVQIRRLKSGKIAATRTLDCRWPGGGSEIWLIQGDEIVVPELRKTADGASNGRIYIFGAVTAVVSIDAQKPTKLSELVLAQKTSEPLNLKRVILHRYNSANGDLTHTIDLEHVLKADPGADIELQGGDRIELVKKPSL